MGKINRLDEHLSNMIAAGEVVERPAGIVKELVENCIDAKSTTVEIQIAQGGIDTITIIDNGIGMDHEDAVVAFERHATSKLKEVNDLWNIHTMGFRGEALPSIASVSHVLMRTNNGQESTEVEIAYGELKGNKPCAAPQGTMLQIRNLFQKTPARFKHLKSPQYEFSLISDVVQKFALSHPEIAFCLSHDGKTVFKTKGSGNLLEVLMQIYGRDVAKSAIKIDVKDNDYHINGYAMQPNFNRATKYYMLLYINHRMVRNYHLQKAIQDAYIGFLPKERFPIVVLDIEMDAQLVDVNVHPSKWEIRLSKEKQLEKLLYTGLNQALKEKLQVIQVEKKEKEKIEIQELELTYKKDVEIQKVHEEVNQSFIEPQTNVNPNAIIAEIYKNKPKPMVVEDRPKIEPKEIKVYQSNPIHHSKPNVDEEKKVTEKVVSKIEPVKESVEEKPKAINPSFPRMEVIGQFHNCYILAQGEAGLYIIDQHAAQEKYHFEQLQKQILAGNNAMQPLLIPLTVESNMAAVTRIEELNEKLSCLGIELEVFGESTFVCRELPAWLKDCDEKKFLEDMIDIWIKDQEISIEKLRRHAVATMACHSSIRFNRSLTMDEMKKVIADLEQCEQPFHCPHGRPTFICMSDKELFKQFLRGG